MFQEQNMKMFLITTAVFILCSLIGRIHCGLAMEIMSANVSQSCQPYETECGLGCCPYAEGVCCIDGFECCQHGQTCIPFIGICVGAVNNNGQVSLTSEKSTRLRSTVQKCPSGTTECAPDKCCLFEDAVCCSDNIHCCPSGYTCDVPGKRCLRDSASNAINREFYSVPAFDKPLQRMRGKPAYKSCPGRGRMCPNYMSCCLNDNNEWGCCPNPSLKEIRYGDGECCDTIFGPMCCPDDYPTCTIFGCTK